jgi:hypothetical protein
LKDMLDGELVYSFTKALAITVRACS